LDSYKTVEAIGMPFGIMSGLGPRNSMLHGVGWWSPNGKGQFWAKHMPNKP